ncbi:hypothetical protein MTR67_038506 [Solanum verrucosum]|uniref:Uncharacterized protein n=1 Tax=Solanum verrucosum TaxID=315347 RepID=A0AAF0ZMY6_SOLVR|nr:hypothetical protein MTR67_038506 [Solanum verrucosum]
MRGKRGFTDMEMQSAVTHILLNCPDIHSYVKDKADWWVVIKSKHVGRIQIDNVLDVAYQNDVAIVQQVDVELETTLQYPQHILEEVFDDEILNVEEEISENEENESFDDEEWDDNENETIEEEEWENDGIETSEEEYQTKQAKKKKSRRPIDPEDIAGSISTAPECISHDTHLFAVLFGIADPRQYYLITVDQSVLHLLHRHCLYNAMRTYLYRLFVKHAPYQHVLNLPQDRLGRVMIEPDGSSWHPAKDVGRALKDCVRRLYTQAYHSWTKIPNNIRQAMFNNFKAISDQAKMARGSLKGGSLHIGGAKKVGTIAREMEKELGRTPIEPEIFKKTHVRKKENESDPDVWVEERAEQTFNDFHQYVAENLDSSIQLTPELSTQIWKEKVIAAMSDQIAKLTAALAESERRRVTEQQSMSETVQQIKEQGMNFARRPTTSAPDDSDDESDEDDYVNLTP